MVPTFRERSVGMCHVPKGPAYGHETAFRRVLNLSRRRVNRIHRPTR